MKNVTRKYEDKNQIISWAVPAVASKRLIDAKTSWISELKERSYVTIPQMFYYEFWNSNKNT